MPKQSAGLLMFRNPQAGLEVFLVHPGGPLWASKDQGAWTLPKGQPNPGEKPLHAAIREFKEETSFTAQGDFMELGSIQQKSGKIVTAWAFAGDCNPEDLVSNTCELKWPPRSGKRIQIPEIDKGRWFSIPEARNFIRKEQEPLLDRLIQHLNH